VFGHLIENPRVPGSIPGLATILHSSKQLLGAISVARHPFPFATPLLMMGLQWLRYPLTILLVKMFNSVLLACNLMRLS